MSKPRRSKSPAKPAKGTPLVSVIMPAFNAERFIERSIESVLDQSYNHFELIIVNDGSTDGTEELVKRFAAKDPRIRHLGQPNAGPSAARNLAIARAKGIFIAPLDSDDLWHSVFLERQVACMLEAGPRVGLTYTWMAEIDDDSALNGNAANYVVEGEVYLKLICCNFVVFPGSCLMRKATLERIGAYDTSGKTNEDWDLNLRIADVAEFRCVPEFLAFYRRHSLSYSHDFRYVEAGYWTVIDKVRKAHPDVPARIYRWSKGLYYAYLANRALDRGAFGICLKYLAIAAFADPTTPIRVLGSLLENKHYRDAVMRRLGLARSSESAGSGERETGLAAIAERFEPLDKARILPLGILRISRLRYIDQFQPNAGDITGGR